ncbi:VOC family protein [Natronomonas salina]|uniref:VOC family protein n=1 Tax=Natronomonas salina TaxID=1710540 RepID=UPI0015B519F1|nr:VOC family protein [Natronomonas salina]QLD90145.1 VOC family protein [Natronomonas salina]
MTTDSAPATLPDETRLGRTALGVGDPERLTEFYGRVVGLEVLARDDESTTLGVGETPLLVLEAAPEAPERPRSAAGLYHNAFRVPSRAALGDALRRVRERWRLDGASDHGVSEALYLTDPEGNGVEIYRDYPREEWPAGDDTAVRMTTDPLDVEGVAAAAGGGEGAPPGTDLGHVHLEVTSLAAFEDVFVDGLGFDVQATVPRARFVGAGGYHHHVGANTWQGRTDPASGRGLAWFEVVVPEPEDLETVRERLSGRDVSVAETDEGFEVTDTDGVRVRLRSAD